MVFKPTTLLDLARVKCGSLTRMASRSHIVKPGKARITHNCITRPHLGIDATIQPPSESCVHL